MKLAVVIPSRGLVFSQTVDELYQALDHTGQEYKVFWSHSRPIPDCFNVPTEEALKDKTFTHFLFTEEDMVIPKDMISRMLQRDTYAISCDYPVSGGHGGTVMYDPEGKAFFTGCGLLLVRADLMHRMKLPIWRTDVRWVPVVEDGFIKFTMSTDNTKHYGQQDVAFGLRLYANGLPIQLMDETIGQRELVKEGPAGSNEGHHEIREHMEVVPRTDLMLIPDRPVFEEILIDGKPVKIKRSTIDKLDIEVEYPDYIRSGRGIFVNHQSLDGWLTLN